MFSSGVDMRITILALATGFAVSTVAAQSDWTPQTSTTNSVLYSIQFTDSNRGWTVGSGDGLSGSIAHTTDGGDLWSSQVNPSIGELFSVILVDSNKGWAVGDFGAIIHTTNGGVSGWLSQSTPTSSNLSSVYFIDSNNGWAVGNDGVILHTTDGGGDWAVQTSPTTRDIFSIYFADSSRGWFTSESGLIYHTSNGGLVWRQQATGVNADIFSVYFTDISTGWAVGNGINAGGDGVILHTTDGGNVWTQQDNPSNQWLADIYFADPNNGWAVGGFGQRDIIIHTTDGGVHWTQQPISNGAWFYSVHFVDANVGWAVGWNGVIIHTTTGGTGIEPPSPTTLSIPPDGSSVSTDPTLSWNPAPNALWYSLQVSASPYFNTYVANKSNIAEKSYDLAGLESDKTYYWRVSITDSTGTSGWSETWSFNTASVTAEVEIDSQYIFVPAEGDTFAYKLRFENLTANTQVADVWTKVLRPVGNPIDPLFGPVTLVIAPFSAVLIDTAKLPVPFDAVAGDYSLVAFVGTYQADTLDTDTSAFFKLEQVPCDSIDQFQARCRSGGTVQARIVLLNSTEYAGEEIIISIDGVDYPLTIITNGTHSKAQTQLTGQSLGDHIVSLISPVGCLSDITATCTGLVAKGGEKWIYDDEPEWEDGANAKNIPSTTALLGNHPNPFNPTTEIRFQLSAATVMSLKAYDILAREVAVLVDGFVEAGYHKVTLDGSHLASGVYYYRMIAGSYVNSKKILLVR